MLATFTIDTFRQHVGEDFHIALGQDRSLCLRLASAEDLREHPAGAGTTRRTPFSLMFHGPAEHFLPQGTHPIRHDTIGEFPLFLVPLGPVPLGPEKGLMRYEAIFT